MTNADKKQDIRLQLADDWKAVLSSPQGRRVLSELLKACERFSPGQLGGPEFNAYQLGKRAVGEFIVRQVLATAPEALKEIYMRGYNHGE